MIDLYHATKYDLVWKTLVENPVFDFPLFFNKGFQIDAGYMALLATYIATEWSSANHWWFWRYRFEILS